MPRLTAKSRKALPASTFAGPGRSYPIPDRGHAIAAKSDASRAVGSGRMSKGEESKIDSKADKMLGRSKRVAPGGLRAALNDATKR